MSTDAGLDPSTQCQKSSVRPRLIEVPGPSVIYPPVSGLGLHYVVHTVHCICATRGQPRGAVGPGCRWCSTFAHLHWAQAPAGSPPRRRAPRELQTCSAGRKLLSSWTRRTRGQAMTASPGPSRNVKVHRRPAVAPRRLRLEGPWEVPESWTCVTVAAHPSAASAGAQAQPVHRMLQKAKAR